MTCEIATLLKKKTKKNNFELPGVFQVSAYEQCSATGPGAGAGLRAERGEVRGPGPAPGADSVGRPWRGVLQVCFNH